jgi:hypothetical protein
MKIGINGFGRIGRLVFRIMYAAASAARGAAAGVFRAGVDPVQLYITIVALGHFYVANLHTLSTIFRADLGDAAALAAREAHCIEVVRGYLRP